MLRLAVGTVTERSEARGVGGLVKWIETAVWSILMFEISNWLFSVMEKVHVGRVQSMGGFVHIHCQNRLAGRGLKDQIQL